jgi:hypothetical protein
MTACSAVAGVGKATAVKTTIGRTTTNKFVTCLLSAVSSPLLRPTNRSVDERKPQKSKVLASLTIIPGVVKEANNEERMRRQ